MPWDVFSNTKTKFYFYLKIKKIGVETSSIPQKFILWRWLLLTTNKHKDEIFVKE
jgi:hypothetical protein